VEHNPTQALTIEVVPDPRADVKILKLIGPLTIHNFFDFQEITRQRPAPRLLFVDVSEVPYIDSAALGSFVGLHVSCESGKRKYALVGANERLQTLFDLTHVKSFLQAYDSMAEAESALA
jgi:anti-sigma B factor antagonist